MDRRGDKKPKKDGAPDKIRLPRKKSSSSTAIMGAETRNEWLNILEHLPDIIITTDLEGRIEYLNHYLPGRNPKKLLGKKFVDLIHPDLRERAEKIIALVLGSNTADTCEFIGISEKKDTHWFSSRICPIHHDGKIRGLTIALTDISERIRMEQILKESEERFREIFEQHYDAIALLKPENLDCLDFNRAAEELFGFNRNDPEFAFRQVFKTKENFQQFKSIACDPSKKDFLISQFTFVHKNGSEIKCGVKGKIFLIRDQEVLYCSFRDIKDKLEFEEKQRQLQLQLIHTNKMTSLGTLSSGIAHEINNPNNFILTNTQMLSDIWKEAEAIFQEYFSKHGNFSLAGLGYDEIKTVVPRLLSNSIEGCRRIISIINRLKEYARPGDTQSREKFDINNTIQFSLSILNNQIKKYTNLLQVKLGVNLPACLGNPQQIEQVIINLVQNALHALPDKNHSVEVSSYFDPPSGFVVVKVSDNGMGIPADILERVTEPFFTTKKDMGGTGLGLYISYSIIKEHRGVLEIKSQTGKGTDAYIKLPAIEN